MKACDKLHISYVPAPLEVGDITNEKGTFVAERKSFWDFWNSMVDYRIYAQLKDMWENYSGNRYVFVESKSLENLVKYKYVKRHWIYSMFGEIENWNVHFREYTSMSDLARKLSSLDAKLGEERKLRERRMKFSGKKTVAQKALAQFPGIRDKKVEDALKRMGNLWELFKDIIENDGQKLSAVKGFAKGGKIIKGIKNELLKKHE